MIQHRLRIKVRLAKALLLRECFYLTPFSIIAYEACFVNAETAKNNW